MTRQHYQIITIVVKQQPEQMIPNQYSQRNQYNLGIGKLLLCGLVFMDLTAFFFLSFMNICFDTLVSDPPVWLLTILFSIMGYDLVVQLYYDKKITIKFVIHALIMLLLILSWAIRVNWVIYLSAGIFLRFPEIIQFNDIIQHKLRAYDILFKIYTFCKIFYMFCVVGHVLGCIFYAIDNTLIKQQYYGPLSQNPDMYYQGSLLCYTPIYSLSQINRYLYCMYYINSLLATVAYGDIIPKNPFQNAYVCILLVLSTASISFIVQQLLIVLSNNWDTVYNILKKLKYFDSMLGKSTGVTQSTRLRLVNFIYHSMLHSANNDPHINRLTPALQFRVMAESIGIAQNKVKKQENIKEELIDTYTLPNFLVQYLTYYPGKYMIVDNQNRFEEPSVFLTSRGQLKIGYGPNFLMRKIIRSRNRLFCWRQFVLNNKSVHYQFRIQTKGLCELYTFSSESLKLMIQQQRAASASDDNFSKMLEMYYIAKDKQLLLLYQESIDHFYSSESMSLIALDANDPDESQQADLVSKHIIRCWGCGNRTHFPLSCPNLHYKISIKNCLAHVKRLAQGTRLYRRTNTRSIKVKPTYKPQNKNQKTKKFFVNYIKRKYEQLNNLNDLFHSSRPKIFEKYQKYQYFYPEYNFSCNSTSDS